MGEHQCPHCGHITTGFEHQQFEADRAVADARDAKIAKLEADNEELIRGMTEMAERFTAAMDKARLSLQPSF